MKRITSVETHYYENKNGTVRIENRVYDGCTYCIKTKLTKREKEFVAENGRKQIFHF